MRYADDAARARARHHRTLLGYEPAPGQNWSSGDYQPDQGEPQRRVLGSTGRKDRGPIVRASRRSQCSKCRQWIKVQAVITPTSDPAGWAHYPQCPPRPVDKRALRNRRTVLQRNVDGRSWGATAVPRQRGTIEPPELPVIGKGKRRRDRRRRDRE